MSDYRIVHSDELYHYGVPGMRWGHRKASVNKDYTSKQRKRDRAFYGNGGEKRINKKLNEGHGLQGARHYEAERKARREKAKKKAKKILSTGVSLYMTDQIFYGGAGTRFAKKTVKMAGRAAVETIVKARGGQVLRWVD